MRNKRIIAKRALGLLLTLIIMLECVGCGLLQPKTLVVWKDYDGTVLEQQYVFLDDAEKIRVPLPEDTNDWHYTKWRKSVTSSGIVYTAQRVEIETHIWVSPDGTVLKEERIPNGEKLPEVKFPEDDARWAYTEWEDKYVNDQNVHVAVRLPNAQYFVGNVFQIVTKDRFGEPLGTGSGFILNEEGWFITNDHVMNAATTATAYFDIPDTQEGGRYTQLEVIGGVYNSDEKDIFIGKLAGYEKLKGYYQTITFTEDYQTDEPAYTLGYPNSSIKMEIHAGKILEEYTDILDKINGVYYVLSDAYIAPGSSGGILINKNFEVIGITAIGLYEDEYNQVYKAGGSIPTMIFASKLKDLDETKLQELTIIYT